MLKIMLAYLAGPYLEDWIHEQIGDNKIWYQNAAKAYYTEHKHYTKHIIAIYCLQSLIGPTNLLSAISCNKFHISKYKQENMKFTIICHLATFLFIVTDKKAAKWQIIVNFMFSCWSFEIWNL